MSRQHRPLARHAGKLSSWFHLFEWMWSVGEKKKAKRVAQNLHMLKYTKALFCKRKSCGYFLSFLVYPKDIFSTYSFQMNNEIYPICCYRRCYKRVCLTMSSQCLKSKPVYTFLWTAVIQETFVYVFALSNLHWCVSQQSHTTSQEFALFRGSGFGSIAGVWIRCSQCQLIFDLWMFEFVVLYSSRTM